MSSHQQPIRFVLNNDLSELERLAEMLDAIKGKWRLTDKFTNQLNLVLDELFTNAVNYGYEKGVSDQIAFVLDREDNKIRVTICDNGRPFDPTIAADPKPGIPLEAKDVGGLGIFLARQYTDSLEYRREDNKNIVTLTKIL